MAQKYMKAGPKWGILHNHGSICLQLFDPLYREQKEQQNRYKYGTLCIIRYA